MRKTMRRLGMALLGLLLMAQISYAQQWVQAKVLPIQLNVHQSPGVDAAIVGQLLHGTVVTVTGRQDAGNPVWVSVTPTSGGASGWVRSDYLQFPDGFDLNLLPVLTADNASAAVNPPPENPPPSNPPPANVSAPANAISGTTSGIVNFRVGPGTNFTVLTMLPYGTPVALTGRNGDSSWLRAVVNGQEGWLYSGYVQVNGDRGALPVIGDNVAAAAASVQGSPYSAWGVPAGVVPVISAHAHQIFVAGQRLGNRANIFSKVGDSITARPQFLTVIGDGGLHLYNYAYLQPVVDYYFRSIARTHNSFGNVSLAAHEGWTSADLLNSSKNTPGICQPDESPLVCEYRVTKPAVALIMIGTNDAQWGVSTDAYRSNLAQIIQKSIDMGVIPVVSTIPDNVNAGGRVNDFNNVIRGLAAQYDVPLWDFWVALQGLPNRGLDPDGIHPSSGSNETAIFTEHDVSSYGFNMRNLTALLVLDAVWKGALY
jgi:uncharacterized protein YraI